jgi:hypothetical protein
MEHRSGSRRRSTDTVIPIRLPAAASVAVGVIHALVVPEHLEEWWLFGTFFVVCAIFQVAWAAAWMVSPTPGLAGAAIVGNGAIVAVWASSRALGLPIGPEPWMAEPIGTLDLLATGLELFIVVAAAYALRATAARRHAATI